MTLINENIQKINSEIFPKLYKNSWYTITGAGGDLNKWVKGYQDLLSKENIGEVKEWVTFTGEEMNEWGHLTGNNAYPKDLTFLAFSLDGLNVGKIAMFKLRMKDRWFDDIVDNNAEDEGYHPIEEMDDTFSGYMKESYPEFNRPIEDHYPTDWDVEVDKNLKRINELEDYLSYLEDQKSSYGRGGNFDSLLEIEEEKEETLKSIKALKDKIA